MRRTEQHHSRLGRVAEPCRAPTSDWADRSEQLFRKTGGFESCGAVEEEPRPTQPTSLEPDPVKPLVRRNRSSAFTRALGGREYEVALPALQDFVESELEVDDAHRPFPLSEELHR